MAFFPKIKSALQKTSEKLSVAITGKRIDERFFEEIEEALILADVGIETASELSQKIAKKKFPKETTGIEIKQYLAQEIQEILEPYESDFFDKKFEQNPHIILVVGVNGSGKTTTIAKIASLLKNRGYSPLLVAADTFRAAAVEQLTYWAETIGVAICAGKENADAAGLVYKSIEKAKVRGNDVVVIDTAGRMQNRSDLLAELEKMKRVIKKIDAEAPHNTILVLDGLTGQSTYSQVDVFLKTVAVNGIVVTKLDGTAKGGALISLTKKFKLNIMAIGVGESMIDLKIFNAAEYSKAILGLD